MVDNPSLYREVLDNIYDGVYFLDRQRKIFFWNKGAERITGYQAADVMGRSCADDILCHVDTAHLGVVAERVRALIAETRIPLEDDYRSVSVSIGATLARPDDSPEALLNRADQLMYQCKMEGRNRVCLDNG
jgi:diguanylate cyclase (GGDEF)-like protein